MLGGIIVASSLLASVVVANPLNSLQARQQTINPSCYSQTAGCTNSALQGSAAAWCQSLGFGASVVTVTSQGTGTSTLRKTLISTTTSFTSTTTKTLPTSTSIVRQTKTTTLTSISTFNITSTTKRVTINAAGTIASCGTYTATPLSSVPTPSTVSSTTSVTTSQSFATDGPDSGTSTTSYPPITSPAFVYPTYTCGNAPAGQTYAADISSTFNYCVGQFAIGYNLNQSITLTTPGANGCLDLCTAPCVAANYYSYLGSNNYGCALGYSDVWYSQTSLTNPTWTAYILAAPASVSGSATATATSTSTTSTSTQSTATSTPVNSPTTTPAPTTTTPPGLFAALQCTNGTPYTVGTNIFNHCTSEYAYGYNIVGAPSPYPTQAADCVALCTGSCVAANWVPSNGPCQLGYSVVYQTSTSLGAWDAYILSTTIAATTSTSTSTTMSTATTTSSVVQTGSPSFTPGTVPPGGTPSSVQGAVCTNTAVPQLVTNQFQNCPGSNLTTFSFKGCSAEQTGFLVSCGSDMYVGPSYPQNYNPGPFIYKNTIQDCAAQCLFDNGNACGGVTFLTGAPDGSRCYYRGVPQYFFQTVFTMDTTYPPYWGLPDNGGNGLYWTSAERLNYGPDPELPTQTETNPEPTSQDDIPGWSIMPQYLPTGSGPGYDLYNYQYCGQYSVNQWSYPNSMGGNTNFQIQCGYNLLEQGQTTNFWVWSDTLQTCIGSCLYEWGSSCGGVTFIQNGISQSLQYSMCFYRAADRNPNFDATTMPGSFPNAFNAGALISALNIGQSSFNKRGELSASNIGQSSFTKRGELSALAQAYIKERGLEFDDTAAIEKRALAQPSCLTLGSAAETSYVCSACVLPAVSSTATVTKVIPTVITSTRTIFTTKNAIATQTITPAIKTITTVMSTITSLRTRTTTLTVKTAFTTTTTGTWALAATPTSFYIVDANNGVAMWPADADSIFYNVQYDDSPESTDPPPTNFGLNGTQLQILDFVDSAGQSDVVVVGQPIASGAKGAQVMAFDVGSAAKPTYLNCKISALADGTCPLNCVDPKSKGNVSWTDANGLWYLLPAGQTGVTRMNSFVLQSGDN